MFTIPELALPASVGAVVTFFVPLILRRHWSKTARRLWSILITAGVTGLVLAVDPNTRIETWEDLTASIGTAIAAAHGAYAILEPFGLYDLIDNKINQTPPDSPTGETKPPPAPYQPQHTYPENIEED